MIEILAADDYRLDSFRWRERQLTTIAQRKAAQNDGLFIAEGDLVVQRALEAGCVPVTVLCDPKRADLLGAQVEQGGGNLFVASVDIRREVTGLGVPLDVIGLFHRPLALHPKELIATGERLLVLDCIDNPSNVGAIVRTAVALGWDGMLLDSTSADPLSRRALRVSMGTALKFRFARVDEIAPTIAKLRACGVTTIGLTPAPSALNISIVQVDQLGRRALVLGAERTGLSEATLAQCSLHVTIPMTHGIDSLNVAAAAAVACYALGG
ncbi:MAG: RNA methyltransferase [Ilumatobacteraceae bacterium]